MGASDVQPASIAAGEAAWGALTAPGTLLVRAFGLIALALLPLLGPALYVSKIVPATALALLAIHAVVSAGVIARPQPRWWALYRAGLRLDAVLFGLLIGASWWSCRAVVIVALIVLPLSLSVGGIRALAEDTLALLAGCVAAVALGLPVMLAQVQAWPLDTALSPEVTFAGVRFAEPPAPAFATALSVETSFAAQPVRGFERARSIPTHLRIEWSNGGAPAPIPAYAPALVLSVLSAGLAVSLWRLRRLRTAVAARMLASQRLVL